LKILILDILKMSKMDFGHFGSTKTYEKLTPTA